jgi:hypothetical protein
MSHEEQASASSSTPRPASPRSMRPRCHADGGRANKVNPAFGAASTALDEALALAGLRGFILASGHKDFCVGADLDFIYRTRDAEALVYEVASCTRSCAGSRPAASPSSPRSPARRWAAATS